MSTGSEASGACVAATAPGPGSGRRRAVVAAKTLGRPDEARCRPIPVLSLSGDPARTLEGPAHSVDGFTTAVGNAPWLRHWNLRPAGHPSDAPLRRVR